MLGREAMTMVRALVATGVVLLGGCESGDPEVAADPCLVDRTSEPIRTCFPRPLEPELDDESPDYGRVSCVVIVSGTAGTPFCDCARPGYAKASDAQVAFAEDELEASGLCEGACCDNRCFCQLEQLSGEELAYCQGRSDREAGPDFAPNGWCYVDADLGLGDPSLVEHCPDSQMRLVIFVPAYVLMNGSTSLLACLE